MLFFTVADSKLDFRKSGRQAIPIHIQGENPVTGEPSVMGKGVLSVGLFKEDDPELDQMKSATYRQISNVVSQEVDLNVAVEK